MLRVPQVICGKAVIHSCLGLSVPGIKWEMVAALVSYEPLLIGRTGFSQCGRIKSWAARKQMGVRRWAESRLCVPGLCPSALPLTLELEGWGTCCNMAELVLTVYWCVKLPQNSKYSDN